MSMSKGNIQKIILRGFIPLAVFLLVLFKAGTVNSDNSVKLYFFWGKGCPHCAQEEKLLKELEKRYQLLEVKSYEVWYDKENARLFSDMTEAYGTRPEGVPTTFIGDFRPLVGYRSYEITGEVIESRIVDCIKNICADPIQKLK